MARKVKCPQCGAKSPEGSLRCRICTAFIVPGGAAAAAEIERERAAAQSEEAALADAAVEFSVTDLTPAVAADASPEEGGIDLDDLDLDSIAVIGDGIAIGTEPLPPPPLEDVELFDPDALVIVAEESPEEARESGVIDDEFETFDPDALVIVEPEVVVRPSDAGPDEDRGGHEPPAYLGEPRH